MSLEANGITKVYDGRLVLDRFSFRFPEQGVVMIVGASGSGKTTLLRVLCGLEQPDSGRITGAGKISVVFQENRLLPWASALENAAIAADEETAAQMLAALGLQEALAQRPQALSGGMNRRVAIARALCVQADTYLFDEPLKGMDQALRRHVLSLIRQKTAGRLLVMVTHEEADIEQGDIVLRL